MNRRGFHKILALGLFDILLTFPSTLVNLLVDTVRDDGVATFWPGWRAAHSNFSSVSTSTSEEWKSVGFGVILGIKFGQWNYPAFAIMFFALFGLTENNRVWYRNIFWKMLKPFGFLPHLKPKSSAIAFGSGPVSDSGVLATMTTWVPWTIANAFSEADSFHFRTDYLSAQEAVNRRWFLTTRQK